MVKYYLTPPPVKGGLYITSFKPSMTSQLVQTPLTLDIAIVGCGISGLAAAYALGKAGHRITVVESSPLLTEVGAGIQVSPSKLPLSSV